MSVLSSLLLVAGLWALWRAVYLASRVRVSGGALASIGDPTECIGAAREGVAMLHMSHWAGIALVHVASKVKLESDALSRLVPQRWYASHKIGRVGILRIISDYQRYQAEAIHIVPILFGEPTVQCGSPEMIKQILNDVKLFPKAEMALGLKYVDYRECVVYDTDHFGDSWAVTS